MKIGTTGALAATLLCLPIWAGAARAETMVGYGTSSKTVVFEAADADVFVQRWWNAGGQTALENTAYNLFAGYTGGFSGDYASGSHSTLGFGVNAETMLLQAWIGGNNGMPADYSNLGVLIESGRILHGGTPTYSVGSMNPIAYAVSSISIDGVAAVAARGLGLNAWATDVSWTRLTGSVIEMQYTASIALYQWASISLNNPPNDPPTRVTSVDPQRFYVDVITGQRVSAPPVAVPGPVAGAGLPLVLGLLGYRAWHRRRRAA